ncbi:aminotransferase class IV family protein [Actinocorallia sp. A-T 12471]|uniref:aminotransferase class IV family protein n=1 Tax=Actinocorallia sp. A-T 12471 TaxID=3089813 RepID=UPI0029CE3B34|nr:aminotransferase class IV family protein [Actinocorallia sp. A-T 12471]MDX6739776.1 aminotransferase class IV family protein [Actinocorallia sp. A-T 12471]
MAELNGAQVSADALQALALTNYGHFTSMRVEDGHVRGYSQHLDRLVTDCRELFSAALDRDRVRSYVRSAVGDRKEAFILRVTVFDPALDLGHIGGQAAPSVLVTHRPAPGLPASPLRIRTTAYQRDLPKVKHVGLLGQLWHRREALSAGFDDCLFHDSAGFISEGATWNIGFFDGHKVLWPNADVLPGVTMSLLKQTHEETVTAPVHVRDIPEMSAAFATNTSVGVRPIAAIDDIPLDAEHDIIDALRKEYQEIRPESL